MVVESDIIVDGATINGDVVDDSFGEEIDGCGCSTAIREDSGEDDDNSSDMSFLFF
jgi:hypothetical protein